MQVSPKLWQLARSVTKSFESALKAIKNGGSLDIYR